MTPQPWYANQAAEYTKKIIINKNKAFKTNCGQKGEAIKLNLHLRWYI